MKAKILVALVAVIGAAGAYGKTVCPIDSVRQEIKTCVKDREPQNISEKKELQKIVSLYKNLDSLQCNSISSLNQEIASLKTELDEMSPIKVLTDETDAIFSVELPEEQSVPASLRPHLASVVRAKGLFEQIQQINAKVEGLESNLSSEEWRKKVIPEQIEMPMDSFGDEWAIFQLSYMDTFSPAQKEYITRKIEEPYQRIYKKYLDK